MKDKYGHPKWINPKEEERKHRHKALNDAAWQKVLEREKLQAQQRAQKDIPMILLALAQVA